MFGLAAAWWLAALALIPGVRWLHRWQAPLASEPVSAVFLWPAEARTAAGDNRAAPPDPAWRRRAAALALAVLALAGPWWRSESIPVTVWIDDSLSMATSEGGASRLAAGLEQLRRALEEDAADDAVLRSLSDPARIRNARDADAFLPDAWPVLHGALPAPPPVPALGRDRQHWLVTDGAQDELNAWIGRAPLARTITVGEATENVAITRLAARRDPDRGGIVVWLEVTNAGRRPAQPQLTVSDDRTVLATRGLRLSPGASERVSLRLETAPPRLHAAIEPADALRADDRLSLDTGALRPVTVAIDAACPATLRRAAAAHPGLAIAGGTDDALFRLACSESGPSSIPTLRFRAGAVADPVVAPLWLPAAGDLESVALRAGWLSATAWPAPAAAGTVVWLADGERPLIVRRPGTPAVVETVLDPAREDLVVQPEYAALIAGLIDGLLGRSVLDPVPGAGRDPDASRIAPLPVPASSAPAVPSRASRVEFSSPLLALALLILLGDAALLWRAGRGVAGG